MKKQQSKRVIPGFGLTMGVTLAMLSIVVLIPLASLAVYSARLGLREFIEVITRAEGFVRILCKLYYCICGHSDQCYYGPGPCVGAGKI